MHFNSPTYLKKCNSVTRNVMSVWDMSFLGLQRNSEYLSCYHLTQILTENHQKEVCVFIHHFYANIRCWLHQDNNWWH